MKDDTEAITVFQRTTMKNSNKAETIIYRRIEPAYNDINHIRFSLIYFRFHHLRVGSSGVL